MITVDVVSWLMYGQLLLTFALFFFVQLLVIAARNKVEQVGDWLVYRGSFYGIFFQIATIAALAFLVFYSETDHSKVTWALALTLLNCTWFVTLRLVFLIADNFYYRQENK